MMSDGAPESLPDMMTGIEITEPGGAEVLRPAELPVPQPAEGELLIKVAAAGVNRPDVIQRQGLYPAPKGASPLPGLEVAGTVVAVRPGVEGFSVGDQVCALVAGGGYAEYCTAPAEQCLPVPAGLSPVEAAALPETVFTVWSNVFDRARLQPGEAFLVHGGSSGIGTTAIQMAKAYGCTVITTAGSAEKCKACADLGADRVVNYREEDFVEAAKAMTGGRGVDVVLDMVGGDYIARDIEAMATEGRHVSIAFLSGAKVTLNMMKVMLKRLTLTGSTLRARPVADKAAIARAVRQQVWPHVEAGQIKPVIYRTLPLAEAAQAHALMESGEHIGKIVLVV
jgi:putative PIG3 family NAD(P)H quinone oxidoreductase